MIQPRRVISHLRQKKSKLSDFRGIKKTFTHTLHAARAAGIKEEYAFAVVRRYKNL